MVRKETQFDRPSPTSGSIRDYFGPLCLPWHPGGGAGDTRLLSFGPFQLGTFITGIRWYFSADTDAEFDFRGGFWPNDRLQGADFNQPFVGRSFVGDARIADTVHRHLVHVAADQPGEVFWPVQKFVQPSYQFVGCQVILVAGTNGFGLTCVE